MLQALQVAALLLAAVAVTASLAHALELPGKMRLSKDAYLAVQQIYYPGFTMAGFGEVAAIPVTLVLALMTPRGAAFWLTLGAFLALSCGHALYWLVTHPVNNFWLEDFALSGASRSFFAFGAREIDRSDWTALRDRWEYSHVARSVCMVLGLALLAMAATIRA
jgi:hypothetical protein